MMAKFVISLLCFSERIFFCRMCHNLKLKNCHTNLNVYLKEDFFSFVELLFHQFSAIFEYNYLEIFYLFFLLFFF